MAHVSATQLATVIGLISAAVAPPQAARADDQALGRVHFETSCTPEAAALFDKGMLYQHSFWYIAAPRQFEAALRADPGCGIAWWGIALSLLWNPHVVPPAKNMVDGASAIAKAREAGARTPRERDYIEALAAMYTDVQTVDHRTRVLNYLRAMEQLAAKYPGDDEAQIQYALTLNVAASPSDKTYANQLKGAAILEEIWVRQPEHPGIAHYLIHLYDSPAMASRGLEAARRYAQVAPDAPHALHMPSHIFTRVGAWSDSVTSNAAAARSAAQAGDHADQLHAMDYLVYAYLQRGEDQQAKAIVDAMRQVSPFSETFLPGPFAMAAAPARYAIERDDWAGAAALEVRPNPLPQIVAITWFAKGLGAARTGDPAGAQAAVDQLIANRDAARAKKDNYWAEQVDIQARIVAAWREFALGRTEEALRDMADVAEAEDRTDKHPVTPGPLAPARELYGEMLLQSGKPAEALAAFEAVMRKEPNRLNTTLDAAKAAEQEGDAAKARQYYEAAVALAGPDADRPGVLAAKEFLSRRG
ncbi:MAG TPA: hypothetical protein VE650_20150 [Acetobacteraceae bacterium]|nr:hypothetical protein [Acetobacteraceae bacterium]